MLSGWNAGPKDLPRVARAAGRVTGQAVSYVSAARSRMMNFAEEADLTKVRGDTIGSLSLLSKFRSVTWSGLLAAAAPRDAGDHATVTSDTVRAAQRGEPGEPWVRPLSCSTGACGFSR